jgi:hypothetical protein
MTQKFGRNYRITIYPIDAGDPIIITMPFTIKFNIERTFASGMNTMELGIYNLSEAHRRRIAQDFNVIGNYPNAPANRNTNNIIVEIGYDNLYVAFQGYITFASSAREGVDIVTRISALDGLKDAQRTQVFQTLSAGQKVSDVLEYLTGQFTDLKRGAVGTFDDILQRPVVLNGYAWDLLKQYSNANCYIDNGKIYVLQDNEYLDTETVLQLSDETGLIGTPRRSVAFLTVKTLLETSVGISDRIDLKSSIMPEYNGRYWIYGIQHEGVISASVGGAAYTTFHLSANTTLGYIPKVVS